MITDGAAAIITFSIPDQSIRFIPNFLQISQIINIRHNNLQNLFQIYLPIQQTPFQNFSQQQKTDYNHCR